MELEVLRISSQVDSTSGILFDVTGGKENFFVTQSKMNFEQKRSEEKQEFPKVLMKLPSVKKAVSIAVI